MKTFLIAIPPVIMMICCGSGPDPGKDTGPGADVIVDIVDVPIFDVAVSDARDGDTLGTELPADIDVLDVVIDTITPDGLFDLPTDVPDVTDTSDVGDIDIVDSAADTDAPNDDIHPIDADGDFPDLPIDVPPVDATDADTDDPADVGSDPVCTVVPEARPYCRIKTSVGTSSLFHTVDNETELSLIRQYCQSFAPDADVPEIDFESEQLRILEIENSCAIVNAVFVEAQSCQLVKPPGEIALFIVDAYCCGPFEYGGDPNAYRFYYIRQPRSWGVPEVQINWTDLPYETPLASECTDWLGPWADHAPDSAF